MVYSCNLSEILGAELVGLGWFKDDGVPHRTRVFINDVYRWNINTSALKSDIDATLDGIPVGLYTYSLCANNGTLERLSVRGVATGVYGVYIPSQNLAK